MGNPFSKPTVWQQMVAMEEEEPGRGLVALVFFSKIDLEKFYGEVNDKTMTVDATVAIAVAGNEDCFDYIGTFKNAEGESVKGLLSKMTEYPEDEHPPWSQEPILVLDWHRCTITLFHRREVLTTK